MEFSIFSSIGRLFSVLQELVRDIQKRLDFLGEIWIRSWKKPKLDLNFFRRVSTDFPIWGAQTVTDIAKPTSESVVKSMTWSLYNRK